MLSSASLRTLSYVEQRLLLFRLLSIELSFALKSLTLFRLDIVGVGQSWMPPFFDDWFGWNKDCMLFFIGGFNSYIESILDVDIFSSFRPFDPFFEETCFFN